MREFLFLRPGALGDVLCTRAALAAARAAHPAATLRVLAPGARGRLLLGTDLADAVFDTDCAEAAWLFSEGHAPPPERLQAFAGQPDLTVAYLHDSDGCVTRNLRHLGCARVVTHPPRPDENGAVHIHEHLAAPLVREAGGVWPTPLPPIRPEAETVATVRERWSLAGAYAVLHPGSGGARKNAPLETYVALGQRLEERCRVVVTAGEADGALGPQLADSLRAPVLIQHPSLPELAAVLAGAALYVGNDSGVSHLAAAVDGPACVVLFGPTRPAVWGPPGACCLCAPGDDWARLSLAEIESACKRVTAAGEGGLLT